MKIGEQWWFDDSNCIYKGKSGLTGAIYFGIGFGDSERAALAGPYFKSRYQAKKYLKWEQRR